MSEIAKFPLLFGGVHKEAAKFLFHPIASRRKTFVAKKGCLSCRRLCVCCLNFALSFVFGLLLVPRTATSLKKWT